MKTIETKDYYFEKNNPYDEGKCSYWEEMPAYEDISILGLPQVKCAACMTESLYDIDGTTFDYCPHCGRKMLNKLSHR